MKIPDSCEDISCTVSDMLVSDGEIVYACFERCILPELRAIWRQGIHTVCSCCGHGDDKRAYIRVRAEDAGRMCVLGYEPYEMHECMVYPGSAAFRAKHTAPERAKPHPPVENPEAVREMWRGELRI